MKNLTIWKFPVSLTVKFSVSMPIGAQLLSVQTQRGEPQIWALVDPEEALLEERKFWLVGTGHKYPACPFQACRYRGTFQMQGGDLVFHLFEEEKIHPGAAVGYPALSYYHPPYEG